MLLVKAPVALTGPSVVLAVRRGRIGRERPDNAVLGGIGNTQSGNISVAGGVVVKMFVTAWVVTVGTIRLVKVTSSPYTVAASLVAYART